jgi:hypothetical protein
MALRGELSPTTANHDFKQQVCNASTEKSSVSTARYEPGLKAGAPRAIRSHKSLARKGQALVPVLIWRPLRFLVDHLL